MRVSIRGVATASVISLVACHTAVRSGEPVSARATSPEGDWSGTYTTTQFSGHVDLRVTRESGEWSAEIRATSPYVEEPRYQPGREVRLDGDSLRFLVDWGSPVEWTGAFGADSASGRLRADHWSGSWNVVRRSR